MMQSVESRYVVLPFSVKVSGSRADQNACLFELAPRFRRKRQRKLIDGEGEQVSKFAHQVGFRHAVVFFSSRQQITCCHGSNHLATSASIGSDTFDMCLVFRQ